MYLSLKMKGAMPWRRHEHQQPRCKREAAAVAVAEMLNKQVLTLDLKAIRLF